MTPLNYEQNGYGQPDPTAADLGLPVLAPAYTAPDWFLDDAPDVAPAYGAVTCCDSYAVEWELRAGPDVEYVLAMERAQVLLLQTEIDRRKAHDLARAAVAQAAETEVRIKDREREVEHLLATRESYAATIKDLREGHEVVRRTLDGFGYTRGSLTDRIEAMHEELVQLRQQVGTQPATEPREPVRDKESAVLSLAYLRAYIGVEDINTVRQHAYPILCELARVWHQRGAEWYRVVNCVQGAGIVVGPTPQDASPTVRVIQGQGGVQRKPAS